MIGDLFRGSVLSISLIQGLAAGIALFGWRQPAVCAP
jgi:hypothetical protein